MSPHLSVILLSSSQVPTIIPAPDFKAHVLYSHPTAFSLTLFAIRREAYLYRVAGCFAIYIWLAEKGSMAGLILFLYSLLSNYATKKDLVYRYSKRL